MTLKELSEKQQAQAAYKAQDTQAAPAAQEDNSISFKDKCIAAAASIDSSERRTLRAVYNLYDLYSKYPPDTPAEWDRLCRLITIISEGTSENMQSLLMQCFDAICTQGN